MYLEIKSKDALEGYLEMSFKSRINRRLIYYRFMHEQLVKFVTGEGMWGFPQLPTVDKK
jgi:hypothetical protein